MISESQKYSDISLFVITESTIIIKYFHLSTTPARLAQSVEHETFNLRVVGSNPALGANFFPGFFKKRLDPPTVGFASLPHYFSPQIIEGLAAKVGLRK